MFRKFIIAASFAGALLVPATASAAPGVCGWKCEAETVVQKRMYYIYGYDITLHSYFKCRRVSSNRYKCGIEVYDGGVPAYGSARVSRSGNHYRVTSMHIYW